MKKHIDTSLRQPKTLVLRSATWQTLAVPAIAIGTELTLLALGDLCLILSNQAGTWLHYLGGALAGTLALHLLIAAIRRRVGDEPLTFADVLTHGRFAAGTLLLALVAAGFTAGVTLAGGLAWSIALVAATLADWLDGPLARRLGPTRLGAALDIEADSWLTLWTAGAAVMWGGLPWWVLAPPLIRYILPIRAWLRGSIPAGGGPWWARGAGVAQMILLLAALAPVAGPTRNAVLTIAAYPVVSMQLLAIFALLIKQTPTAWPVTHPQKAEAQPLLRDEEQ